MGKGWEVMEGGDHSIFYVKITPLVIDYQFFSIQSSKNDCHFSRYGKVWEGSGGDGVKEGVGNGGK